MLQRCFVLLLPFFCTFAIAVNECCSGKLVNKTRFPINTSCTEGRFFVSLSSTGRWAYRNTIYKIMTREEAIAAGMEVHEIQHSMKRRTPWHDYSRKGTYMLTLVVGERVAVL